MYKPVFNFITKSLLILFTFSVASCTTDTNRKQEKAEIAILMPLSGPHKEQGEKLASLIKYGLEDNLNGQISTTTYDVATEDYINQAIPKMKNKRTQIILGPLFSPSVKSIENFAATNQIIILTLSNNPLLAKDEQIYVFGHTPLKQVNMLIKYYSRKGYKEFALLSQKSKTSSNLQRAIHDMAHSSGGHIFTSEFYEPSQDAIQDSIQKLSAKVDNILEDEDKYTKPVIIVQEENPSSLKIIFDEIKKHNLDKKAIIAGDSRIDIDYSEGIDLTFVGSPNRPSASVTSRFYENFGSKHLNYLENLAYDLGSISSVAVNLSYDPHSFKSRLKSPAWYKGLSGNFRFQGAMAERKYSIIKRSGRNYDVLYQDQD
ncbi:MAG: penicillin-binding protein activator [Rickettsiaceae bacterium]|nr:penicillin-binding protein activator [Rickettsiaceae bacterium]